MAPFQVCMKLGPTAALLAPEFCHLEASGWPGCPGSVLSLCFADPHPLPGLEAAGPQDLHTLLPGCFQPSVTQAPKMCLRRPDNLSTVIARKTESLKTTRAQAEKASVCELSAILR